jgi:hypothetical protein
MTLTCLLCHMVATGRMPWHPLHDCREWVTGGLDRRRVIAAAHGLRLAPGATGRDRPWVPIRGEPEVRDDWDVVADGLAARVEAAHRRTRRKKGCRRPVGVPGPPAAINMSTLGP